MGTARHFRARAVPAPLSHTVSLEGQLSTKPRITCAPNGPYLLKDMQASAEPNLVRSSGAAYDATRGVALCRCGGSKTKPFCDGTHKTNGFSDRKSAGNSSDPRAAYRCKRITIFDNRAICAHAGVCTDSLKSVFLYVKEPWIDPDGAAVDEIMAAVR